MALTDEQREFITELVEGMLETCRVEGREPEAEAPWAGGLVGACQFEGIGVPEREDVEELVRRLRAR